MAKNKINDGAPDAFYMNDDKSDSLMDMIAPDTLEDSEEADKKQRAIARREKLETAINTQKNIWGYSSLGIEANKAAMTMLSTKTGMYSRIPLVCKGQHCPYVDTCKLSQYDLLPIGEYCPLETAQIEFSMNKYVSEFDISEDDFTDQNILKEIVNLEIMMERCKSLMSKEQNPVIDVITNIPETGDEFYHPEVSKAFEVYERCQKQHSSLLNLMNATRKDKAASSAIGSGNSISDIMDVIQNIDNNGGFVDPMKDHKKNTTYVYCDKTNDELQGQPDSK